MKLSRKEQKYILYALGVVIVFVVYVMVFQRVQDMNEKLQSKRMQLQSTVSQMEAWDANKETYQQKTKEIENKLASLYEVYPAEVKEETTIMFGRQLENNSGLHISAITIGEQNLIYSTGNSAMSKYLYRSLVDMEYTGSYAGIKTAVEQIQQDNQKKNVESISLAYDTETANLIGKMTVNFYSLAGSNKIYEKPVIPEMPIGSSTLFGQ